MAYTGTFLGAEVRAFRSTIGWNMGSPSTLTVGLVNDPALGNSFAPVGIGQPVYFQFYGFTFAGLLQKWEERRGQDGNPIFEVTAVDPREILEGAQIITSSYSGETGSIRNLFNAFGYWEAQGFGQSLSNESGMPWHKIREAVTNMANQPAMGTRGGPLTFQGFQYGLDLSDMPSTPSYYRVGGGVSISLLEAIAQVCEDGGVDFFIELVGSTIRVRTHSRAVAPRLGTITAIANSNKSSGTLVNSAAGLECRNEITSAFLVGGEQTTLWMTTSITQFWGYDVDGAAIYSSPWKLDIYNKETDPKKRKKLYTINADQMILNASPISDIIGDVRYPCTTLEMRLAQANKESWLLWMKEYRPKDAQKLGITSIIKSPAIFGVVLRPQMVNDDKDHAQKHALVQAGAGAATEQDKEERIHRLYEFVRGYADEYYGKKFLVGLPFIIGKTEPETLKLTTNWEVVDGGYLAENAEPLGLSSLNQDIFKTQDGRFRAFAVFDNLAKVDLTKVNPHGSVVDNNKLYQEIQTDPRILSTSTPSVVVSLNGPICERQTDMLGDTKLLVAIFQMDEKAGQKAMQQAAIPFKVSPGPRTPVAIAIPLKSNVQTYGPWMAGGAPGKVRVEHDPSLTPWGYGSYALMTQAATSRVNNAITSEQITETGSIEITGPPTTSLGNILDTGGPAITNIDVQVGQQGVTTAYRFATFTPKFGLFSRGNAERLKRVGLAGIETRRNMRQALKERLVLGDALSKAQRTRTAFREREAKALKRETPHDVLHCFSAWDASGKVMRSHASMATMEESIVMSNAHESGLYLATAMMGLNGLIRPFSTNFVPPGSGLVTSPGSGVMARYTSESVTGRVPRRTMLDPWGWEDGNDIDIWSWGNDYKGINAYERGGDGANARVFGLRAPLVLVGWGYGSDGKCVPSSGDGTTWDTDTPWRQDKWKAGPLDALWDEPRGVWTVHDSVKGTLMADLPANGSGTITVSTLGGTTYPLTIYNYYSATVSSGSKCFATYVATDNRWYITSADCPN